MTRIQTIGVAAFLALSLVLAISLPAIAISHNHHGTHITKSIQDLLPVDLDAYCKRHNPYYDARLEGIDLYNLCNYYYRTGYAMDRLRDAYNAHSWTCWSA